MAKAEAIHVMATKNAGRLPVRRGDRIVGMIGIMEIFDEVKKVILAQ